MKAKFKSYYRSAKTGQPVFVYAVTATAEEKDAFKKAKGSFYREDEDGNPLYYSSRPLSTNKNETIQLDITVNGNIVADDSDKVFFQAAKLEDYVEQEKAKILAARALSVGGLRALNAMTAPSMRTATDANVPVIEPDDEIFNQQQAAAPVDVAAPLNV